jgi:hypothetical protein
VLTKKAIPRICLQLTTAFEDPKDENEKTNQLDQQGASHARSLLPTITFGGLRHSICDGAAKLCKTERSGRAGPSEFVRKELAPLYLVQANGHDTLPWLISFSLDDSASPNRNRNSVARR